MHIVTKPQPRYRKFIALCVKLCRTAAQRRPTPRNGYTFTEDSEKRLRKPFTTACTSMPTLAGTTATVTTQPTGQTVEDYETTVARPDLTDRQAQVLRLRMQGKGYKAIATLSWRDAKGDCKRPLNKSRKGACPWLDPEQLNTQTAQGGGTTPPPFLLDRPHTQPQGHGKRKGRRR